MTEHSAADFHGVGSAISSPDAARATQYLLVVLSLLAGCTDVIGFLGLGGLFTNHITGNLVLLAAHVVRGGDADLAKLLSVPVYVTAAVLTAVLAHRLEARGLAPLRVLLVIQLALLATFLGLAVAAGTAINPNAAIAVCAGMFGVAAMAVQNTLVQIALEGVPPTAIMTGNVTRFAVDISHALLRGDPGRVAKARHRAASTLPLILAFAAGCAIGAACESAVGLRAIALPVALSAIACAFGFVASAVRVSGPSVLTIEKSAVR